MSNNRSFIYCLATSLLATTFLFFSHCSYAQSRLSLDTPIPNDPSVKIGTLKNGLRYYIKKNGRPKNKVELRLLINAGSVDEDDDQQGLAHFVEHMAFNGTKNFKKNALIDALRSIGVEFGADLNAYTTFDHTMYMLPIPTNKEGNIELGFKILEEWAHGITLDPEEIENERNIIVEEARQKKGVNVRFSEQYRLTMLNNSKYAKRFPIGLEEIIKSTPPEPLHRFYKDWYRPNLMAVIVVGDITPAEAEKLIVRHFSRFKNPVNERKKKTEDILPYQKNTALVLTDKEQAQHALLLTYSPETYTIDKQIKDYRETIIATIYEEILGKRLSELALNTDPPYQAAGIQNLNFLRNYRFISLALAVGQEGRKKAIQSLMQEVSRVQQFGFTDHELTLAKKIKMRNIDQQVKEKNNANSANYITSYIDHFLHHYTFTNETQDKLYWDFLLPTIHLEDINSYAKQAFSPETNIHAVYFGSNKDDKDTPDSEQLLEEIKLAQAMPVNVREKQEPVSALMQIKPPAGEISYEKSNNQLGTVEMRLSNGIKVTLKKTDFKNDEILFSVEKFGGSSQYSNDDYLSAQYSDSLISAMGFAQFTPIQLQDILAGKSVSLTQSISTYTELLYGNSSAIDIETFLQLLHLTITSPRKDYALFETKINSWKDKIKQGVVAPEAIFQEQFVATLFDDHPRAGRQPTAQEIDKIDIDRIFNIYQERNRRFFGTNFVFVGNIDLKKIRPLIRQYIASIPTDTTAATYRDIQLNPVKGRVKKEVYAGRENKAEVRIQFTGPAPYSREEQTRFHALSEILKIKMDVVLREKLGLVYSSSVDASFERIPSPRYSINFHFPCAPENADAVISALFTEISTLKSEGSYSNDIKKIKTNWRLAHRQDIRENNNWRDELQESALFNTDAMLFLGTPKRIGSLTAQQIQAAAKRYLNTENYVQMVLKPEQLKSH